MEKNVTKKKVANFGVTVSSSVYEKAEQRDQKMYT